jgi:hypothetical protein
LVFVPLQAQELKFDNEAPGQVWHEDLSHDCCDGKS